MAMNIYDRGDLVRCTGTLTNSAGTAIDPTGLTVMVRTPAGATTTFTYGTDAEVVRSSIGIYYIDVSVTQEGDWAYRFASTGTGQAAAEGRFRIRGSFF